MMTTLRSVLLAGLALAALPAQAAAQRRPADLGMATIEELMDMRVTTAGRRSQRAEDVPAAIYVITREAIRQSGLASVPEILRLAPGVQVAQVSASRWAISIRGFNDLYSNKLLVLIDGRSVYSRTFSGVFWDMQDVVVADIDRIEVIRGPGGVAWGANAVNGVINIITRPASETQGTSVDLSVGTSARGRGGIRHGGTVGAAAYRVFSQWTGFASNGSDSGFDDRWHSLTSGARVDWAVGGDAIHGQAHFTTNRTRPGWVTLTSLDPRDVPSIDDVGQNHEFSALAGWTHTAPGGSILQVQGYHTSMGRDESIARLTERATDLDVQYESRVGSSLGLVLGGGYRSVAVSGSDTVTSHIGSRRLDTSNVFAQGDLAVHPELNLVVGVKVDSDTLEGIEFSPSARAMWQLPAGQRLWAGISRAQRTPAVVDRDFQLNLASYPGPGLPIVFAITGNDAYHHETLIQAEAGYRARLGTSAAVDVTGFHGRYDGLPTVEPLTPTVLVAQGTPYLRVGGRLSNLLNAHASGVEISGHWDPAPTLEVHAAYSLLDVRADAEPTSLDTEAGQSDGNAPAHQWQLHSSWTPRAGIRVSGSFARTGRLRRLEIPAYTRVDARAEFRVGPRLTVAAVGQNLASRRHMEFANRYPGFEGNVLFTTSTVPRSARIDLRWEF
jgi:iron complex outermembrane recepter protein